MRSRDSNREDTSAFNEGLDYELNSIERQVKKQDMAANVAALQSDLLGVPE